MEIAFVVLHYNSIKYTKRCVESLVKYLDNPHCEVYIVVVDNGSPKEKLNKNSFEYLDHDDHIKIICSEYNLGFARGNNLGYEYAKTKLQSNIIVLSNNDLMFSQSNFVNELISLYKTNYFDIAGPKIIRERDGFNVNPEPRLLPNKKSVKNRILKDRILKLLSYFFGLDMVVSKKIGSNPYTEKVDTSKNDFQLHGACLIFANRYVVEQDGLYDKTFLYGEEEILRYLADVNSYKVKYFDTLQVNHVEGGSTEGTYENNAKKRRFRYSNAIASRKLLLKLMHNNG